MLSIEHITRVLCGAYQENAWWVCPPDRGDGFLVDPGDDLNQLDRIIKASGRSLSAILLTHGHFDHMLASQGLSERFSAPVYIHKNDEIMLDDPDASAYSPEVCSLAPPKNLKRTFYQDTLALCGEEISILPTPGHSKGSVCLLCGGILFSGDTLFRAGYGRTDLFGGSDREMVSSLMYILKTLPEDTIVLPGHGDATTIGLEKRRYRL